MNVICRGAVLATCQTANSWDGGKGGGALDGSQPLGK